MTTDPVSPAPDLPGLPDLLARLRILDVRLTADGDTLHYDAPAGTDTDELLPLLRRHKPDLLRFLAAQAGEPQPQASGPATYGQRRLHDKHVRSASPGGFNVAQQVRLTGHLDVPALGRALTALLRRQTALRSRFTRYGDELVQEVMEVAPVRLDVTDLRGLPAPERDRQAREWLLGQAVTPFDLSVPPLLHAALLRTSDTSWTLILVIHHIALDGWGLGVLMDDLGALYTAALRAPGAHPPTDAEAGLAPLAATFADAARHMRDRLSGPAGARLRSYWERTLGDVPLTMALPYDLPRPDQPSGAGGHVYARLSRQQTGRVQALAGAGGSTVFTVLLSAFGTLLCRLTGQPEVLVACNIVNRTRQEHEPLVGMFANNVGVRLGTADAPAGGEAAGTDGAGRDAAGSEVSGARVVDAIATTARTFFSAADHQEYPFTMVLGERADRDTPQEPRLPQVICVMESQGVPVLDLPGLTAEVSDVPTGRAVGELALVLTPDADGIEVLFLYAKDRFEHATVERWADAYMALLQEYVRQATPAVTVR